MSAPTLAPAGRKADTISRNTGDACHMSNAGYMGETVGTVGTVHKCDAAHLRRAARAAARVLLAVPALLMSPLPTALAQEGSAERGRQIATSGANGVTACVACHGAQGEGNPAGGFPRLAGQPAFYLERQMDSFADGRRENAVMTPIAKAMNAGQRRDTSAWYASLKPAAASSASTGSAATAATAATAASTADKPNAAQQKRALALANHGDERLQVQACVNCHGPNGAGEAPAYPSLAGQHASYLTAAMAEWKSGVRKTDPSGQMPSIAKRLGDQDVAALSAYYAAQPPQSPALHTNIPAGSTARPAVAARADASGPRTTAPTQGVGTEQGSPLTGGNQGQGGGGSMQGTQPQQGGQQSGGQSGEAGGQAGGQQQGGQQGDANRPTPPKPAEKRP